MLQRWLYLPLIFAAYCRVSGTLAGISFGGSIWEKTFIMACSLGWKFRADMAIDEWPAIRASVQASQERVAQRVQHKEACATETQRPLVLFLHR
jgi:hypothetical protein